MDLTDAELTHFVNNRLKLSPGQRKKYLDQIDNLIAGFQKAAEKSPGIDVVKFLKAGSLVKGTVLRPRDGFPVDGDVAVFLKPEGTAFNLDSLHKRLRRMLVGAYPTKKPEDFTVQPRTLGIVFHGSGLEVDFVPVIPLSGPGDFGLQPSSRGKPPLKTSIARQLEFIQQHKDRDPRFSKIVRMLKAWRNYKELDGTLRSFMIELIVCHLQDTRGLPASVQDGVLRFFLYLGQGQLREPIHFPVNARPAQMPRDRVVIIDPVNAENNVASRLTDADAVQIAQAARIAWERITAARQNSFKIATLELWKEVFGRSFAIEE